MKWLGQRVQKRWPRAALGFEGSETGLAAISRRIEERRSLTPPSADWLRAQAEENVRLGAPATLRAKVDKIASGAGVVVLAGQQVALHGGPLYSVYKLITAVVLAEQLERHFELPVLPVFWSVSDDADFGEVSASWLIRPGGRLLKLRDTEVPRSGTRIGTLSSERQGRAVAEQAAGLAEFPWAPSVLDRLAATVSGTENWQQFQTALFHQILPETNVLVLDGGDPDMLGPVRPWLCSAGETEPLRSDLAAGAEVSRSLALEPSFEVDLAERALFRFEGDLRLPVGAGPGPPSELLAPNVVLRPLLQDHLLPNVATVCGPSEIRYRAQLGPVYRRRAVPEPLRVPRLSAVLLPPLAPHRLHGDLSGYGPVLEDPKQFIRDQIEREPVPTVEHDLRQMREDQRARFARLLPELEEIDKSLAQLVGSAAGKADYQFARMLEGIEGQRRQQLLKREPVLATLADWVRPRDREQERVLSALLPIWLEGWRAFEPIRAAAEGSLKPGLAGEPHEVEDVFLLDGPGRDDRS